MPQPLSWSEVTAQRLDRHGLGQQLPGGAADAAAAMLGAHAQVASAAQLSLGMRLTGVTRADVERAVTEQHSLVKTYGPRGTVHLLAAADLPLFTGALAAVPPLTSQLPASIGLQPGQADEIIAGIAAALAADELTAEELDDAIGRSVGAWASEPVVPAFQGMWPRWRLVISRAAHRGALVFGSGRCRTVTYTNPTRWQPGFAPEAPETASRELLRRYLRAYGPAAPEHYAQWLSAPRSWAASLFDSLGAELTCAMLGESTVWMLRGDAPPTAQPRGIRLLPYFDAFVVGSHPRELLFPGSAADRALSRGQAGNFPVLLIDGVVGGVWHLGRSSDRLQITVEPLKPLTKRQRALLDDEVQRTGMILEGTPALTIGPVSVGPHA
ncbi:winged helix DNA-binding domain-containing protein [Salinibacterium sp. ZJ454]|uniref:winged helix DNA-binding domain-containing protein n=1 Tax=Salinibacterium sp. ZJ454 TaxID=2708339 RepID=UPI0014249CCA|nr:winged helix DNA-binding domain-containing protein [Salinibacterium sp. ZJ454]